MEDPRTHTTGDLTFALFSSPGSKNSSSNQAGEMGTRSLASWSGMPGTSGLVHSSMHSMVCPVWYAAGCGRGGYVRGTKACVW